jgi:hypothetical protein
MQSCTANTRRAVKAEDRGMSASFFFIIDWVVRPFAKIFEKMPLLMLGVLMLLYGYIAYIVFRSVQTEHG